MIDRGKEPGAENPHRLPLAPSPSSRRIIFLNPVKRPSRPTVRTRQLVNN